MKKIGIYLFVIICLSLVLLISSYYYISQQTTREGQFQVPGLENPVKITFDTWGIPHISASSKDDVFYSLGYIQAQDRMIQLDLFRRLALGRLSEVAGMKALEVDRFFRTLGLDRYSKKIAAAADQKAEHIQVIKAYLRGINDYLKSQHLGVESYLWPEIEPFTLADVYAVAGYMTYSFDLGLKDDLLRLNTARLDPALRKDLLGASMSKSNELQINESPMHLPKIVDEYMDKIGRLEGSNSIVIAGNRTQSGKSILANDTHIRYSNPSIWYEAALKAPGMEIYGHFLPLIAVPLIGHNESHAWAITIFNNEDIDLIPETAGRSPQSIVRDGQELALTPYKSKIHIKDAEPVELTLYDSPYGPEVGSIFKEDKKISLRWGYFNQKNDSLRGFYELIFADTTEKAQDAIYQIDSPSLNISYTNHTGDIAWWTTGMIKKTADSYNSFIPKSEHPQAINPAKGYIHSTNDKPSPMSLGHYIYPQRRDRLEFLASEKEFFSIEDIKELHRDSKIDYHYPIVLALRSSILKDNPEYAINYSFSAFAVLERWKGHHPVHSVAPTIFYQFCYEILKETLGYHLDKKIVEDFMESEKGISFLLTIIKKPHSMWWDNPETKHPESMNETLLIAWKETLHYLESQYGTNVQDWYWGKAHKLLVKHVFSEIPLLGPLFTIGPRAASGGKESLNKISFPFGPAPFTPTSGPATRIIVDFSNPLESLGIIPTGQSERVFDPHFKDQLDLYLAGKYRSQILRMNEKEGKTLILTPINKTM